MCESLLETEWRRQERFLAAVLGWSKFVNHVGVSCISFIFSSRTCQICKSWLQIKYVNHIWGTSVTKFSGLRLASMFVKHVVMQRIPITCPHLGLFLRTKYVSHIGNQFLLWTKYMSCFVIKKFTTKYMNVMWKDLLCSSKYGNFIFKKDKI